MITKIAEYKIKEEELEKATHAIEEIVSKVNHNEPGTVYKAFRRGESLEFIHFMTFPDAAAESMHASAEYTEKFARTLKPICDIEPHFTDLTLIEE